MLPGERGPVLLVVVERDVRTVARAVYSYARHRGVHFSAIHVLTTRLGFDHVKFALLGSGDHPGHFDALYDHLGLSRESVDFDARHVHALRRSDGVPVTSSWEVDDPVSLVDQVQALVRELVRDRDCELYVTADTPSFLLAAGVATVLQAFGVVRGTMFEVAVHPLVAIEIERRGTGDFYFPRGDLAIGGTTVAEADILICRELPLLWCRPLVDVGLVAPYSGALAAQARGRRAAEDPDPVVIDLSRREISVAGRVIPFAPSQVFWYAVLAQLGERRLQPELLTVAAEWSDLMRPTFVAIFLTDEGLDDTIRLLGGSRGYLASIVSKMNSVIRSTLGSAGAPYLVLGGKGRGGYRCTLDPARVRVVWPRPPVNDRQAGEEVRG